ncbi:M81 family metallopeptidase [Paraburkholderia acidiphila]|uniref:Microcystinase C n=1 Tax=Paraburkholderia acidiphila TaxID=2571747 RepID=A0A7Z2GC07_9BURK|nr:M81 family metallopeptidase [Paraburkholderia acidiphila]QGZ58534.1 microcystin degradation protein MlrC [Paraburkholderia acidiphila]
MRLLLAMFKHETNTFSPVPTPFERFFRRTGGALSGAEALEAFRGTGGALGAYIDVADELGAQIVLPVAADAFPSGPVHDDAYRRITQLILDEVAKGGYDGILLDLHGAMVTQSLDDGEGTLLHRLREIDPHTPVGVTLDMHANLYDDIVKHATVVTGYHTYPHVDMYEAGLRAARILARTIAGEIKPVMAWGNKPMLPHVMRQGTHAEPNRSLQARCMRYEQGEALASSLFVGFPNADIENAGLSVVVCTDGDKTKAATLRDSLLDEAWRERETFLYASEPLPESIARAKASAAAGPLVLLDHCVNTASGGTMDTTEVLAEVLKQGLDNAVFYAIYDPEAVQQAIAAGIGNEVTLSLGGKLPMPALQETSRPIEVTGRVKLVFDGVFRNRGPMYRGSLNNTGPTVVLDTGKVEIVVVSAHQEPFDLNCLSSVGIDPTQKRYIVLKSRVHWRAGFGDLAREVIECAGVGVTTSDYGKLEFRKVRRPIYPLDAM